MIHQNLRRWGMDVRSLTLSLVWWPTLHRDDTSNGSRILVKRSLRRHCRCRQTRREGRARHFGESELTALRALIMLYSRILVLICFFFALSTLKSACRRARIPNGVLGPATVREALDTYISVAGRKHFLIALLTCCGLRVRSMPQPTSIAIPQREDCYREWSDIANGKPSSLRTGLTSCRRWASTTYPNCAGD